MKSPSYCEFQRGYQVFQARERRDAMYKTATFLVNVRWGYPSEMADSLGVLLLTWNNAFYRYGPFDFDILEKCLEKHHPTLTMYRQRDIQDYTPRDDRTIRNLFEEFLFSLKICEAKSPKVIGRKSPVAVSKTLHLLAPKFFPLWDDKIARAYNCYYSVDAAGKYLAFLAIIKDMCEQLELDADCLSCEKTPIKLIDEYNYAKYTRGWV